MTTSRSRGGCDLATSRGRELRRCAVGAGARICRRGSGRARGDISGLAPRRSSARLGCRFGHRIPSHNRYCSDGAHSPILGRAPTHPSLPQTLTAQLQCAGFVDVNLEGHAFATTAFESDTYGGFLVSFIAQFVVGRDGISKDEATAWGGEQRESAQRTTSSSRASSSASPRPAPTSNRLTPPSQGLLRSWETSSLVPLRSEQESPIRSTPRGFRRSGAAQESNLTTDGLHRPAGFEDRGDLASLS